MAKDSRDLSGTSPEFLGAAWFDPIEVVIRDRVRGFIENLVAAELDDALGRPRYQRAGAANVASGTAGYRHGRRARQLLGSFGAVTISVPRARLNAPDGTSREWHSEALPRYARMTRQVEALIAGAYRPVPTPVGYGERWERCSRVRSAKMSSAAPGGRCRRIGRRGATVLWLPPRMLSD